MNHLPIATTSFKRSLVKAAFLLVVLCCFTGCGNMQVKIRQPNFFTSIPEPRGSVMLRVSDERWTTGRIGVIRGGFGNEVQDIVLADNLTAAFTNLFTHALEAKGYSVVSQTNAQLDVKITMFVMDTTGWGKFARHKATLQLRDAHGEIQWEENLLGEAAGATGWRLDVTTSMEDCMNLALERMIEQAIHELSSEFFIQRVQKLNQSSP